MPHGRHGLPPEFVAHNQRQRLIVSFMAVLYERGYSEATIGAVTEGAGVSSRTFYKYFETLEDCYLAAFQYGIDELRPAVVDAFEESNWVVAIGRALEALLTRFDEEPELARLLTTEPFAAGPRIANRAKEATDQLVPFLRRGRELLEDGELLPPTTEHGLLGAATALIARRAVTARGSDYLDLLPDLHQFLLTPYLGPAQAHRRSHA